MPRYMQEVLGTQPDNLTKRLSITESLEMERSILAERVDRIDVVLSLLRKNPDIQKVLDILSSLGIR